MGVQLIYIASKIDEFICLTMHTAYTYLTIIRIAYIFSAIFTIIPTNMVLLHPSPACIQEILKVAIVNDESGKKM